MTPLEAEGDTGSKSLVTDHAFEPRDRWWWSLCRHCGLGEAAHARTTNPTNRPTGEDLYCRECGVRLTEQESTTCSVCYARMTEAEL